MSWFSDGSFSLILVNVSYFLYLAQTKVMVMKNDGKNISMLTLLHIKSAIMVLGI